MPPKTDTPAASAGDAKKTGDAPAAEVRKNDSHENATKAEVDAAAKDPSKAETGEKVNDAKSSNQVGDNGPKFDNKTRTDPVPGQPEGLDSQQVAPQPISTDPSNQLPGGVGFNTRAVPEGHSTLSPAQKIAAYCKTFVDSSPDDRIVFGSANVAITMGDLRAVADFGE